MLHGDSPPALEELKKTIESLPAKANPSVLNKNILKYQEINLGLINLDDEATAEELLEIEAAAKQRAGGKAKPKTLMKKGKQKALRTGKGVKKLDFKDQMVELIEVSFKTTNDLGIWVYGGKANVIRHLKSLKDESEPVITKIQADSTSEEAIDNLLILLKKYEDEKQGIYGNPDLGKNIDLVFQKCEKMLETTGKILETPLPEELTELNKRPSTGDLTDSIKRIGMFLSIFFKMTKEATGIDEGSENVEDTLASLKKKQVLSMLPFDIQKLLDELTEKSENDLQRLKFLSKLVGNDEEISLCTELENRAKHVLNDKIVNDSHEAIEKINLYLHEYPDVYKEIKSKTNQFLDLLLNKLCNPEPLERDVGGLIETSEILALGIEMLTEPTNEIELLNKRKDELPTSSKDLLNHLIELVKDYSKTNLALVASNISPITKEQEGKLNYEVSKKLKSAPVQIVRSIEHLFEAPDTQDMIGVIIRLNKLTNFFVGLHPIGDPSLYSECQELYKNLATLTPSEIKALGQKYTEALLSFIDITDKFQEILESIEEEETTILTSRRDTKIKSTLTWEEIFKSKGLDIDPSLLFEKIAEEQAQALVYIETLPRILGNPEQRALANKLVLRSADILEEFDPSSKFQNYVQLRNDQSKLIASLCVKLENVLERVLELDKEKENSLAVGVNGTRILVEKNNPELKAQLQMIVSKEEEYKSKNLEQLIEVLMRFNSRLSLEKELQRIKDEARPAENSNEELTKNLSELEQKFYQELKALNSTLVEFSQEFHDSLLNLKHLTDPQVSSTIPELLGSLTVGLDYHSQILSTISSIKQESSLKNNLKNLLVLLEAEAVADDLETDLVFSGLFRLCGTAEDKTRAKKLREGKFVPAEDKIYTIKTVEALNLHFSKLLPMRTNQSRLQNKLIKDVGKTRDSIDDIDLMTEEILNKAIREIANSILSDDTKSRENLDSLRKTIEKINEESPVNIPECVERIYRRLEIWETLERLRKDLREKASKEISRLKGEIQDKINELATANATVQGQKTQYEAQIVLLQNNVDLNAGLVEKLTTESANKEKSLSNLKIELGDLKNEQESLKESLQKLEEDNESNNKELRTLRRFNKEKEAQIRDLQGLLDTYERNTEKTSLGDKEKSEILERYKTEINQQREDLNAKIKQINDLEDSLSGQQRISKKLDQEKNNLEKELEKLGNEKNQLKAEVLKLSTEKFDLEESIKMNEGVNPDELKHLERILEDKQKELEECKNNLVSAKRYQLLYPELILENQETENKLRNALIDNDDLKRKYEEFKSDNEAMKFKLASTEGLQKELAELSKENQKLLMRLNYLETSSGVGKEGLEGLKKFTEEISLRDSQIKDLNEEIEKLKQAIQSQINKHEKSLSRSFLIRICHMFKEMQGNGFKKWRYYKPQAIQIAEAQDFTFTPVIDLNEEESQFVEDYKEADKFITEDNKKLLNNNKVMIEYKSIDSSNEKPMSFVSVFKFLENLLNEKFETDKRDVAELKPISSIPEFLIESLVKTFGIYPLALKFLAQFVPGLYSLYNEGQPYAIFFARLLQLFHVDPVSYSLGIYLVKVRMEFNTLIEKYERLLQEQNKSKESSKKENYARSAYEIAGNGGVAGISDVVQLIYSLFAGDRESGEKALELIKPQSVSIEDFVAFKICHKMAKLGKTPEMIFNILDKDQGGTIDVDEFLTGTKVDLDLWISDKNILKLLAQLDNGTKEISKDAFMNRINMKFLMECQKSLDWVVSKCTFLTSLVEVYKYKQRKTAAHLIPKISSYESPITKESFYKLVDEYDQNLGDENAEKLYEEAKANTLGVNPYSIQEVFSKYGLGELKSFKNRELIQELYRRKLVVSVDESVAVSTKLTSTSFMVGNVRIDRDEEEKTIIRKKVVKKVIRKDK